MATTAVDVAQLALAAVGDTTTITSITAPTTKPEKLVAMLLDRERDRLLGRHNWSWATRRATLVVAASEARTGWGYCYSLPADCVRPITLEESGYRSAAGTLPTTPWAIEANGAGTGTILCTDSGPDPVLIYVARVTAPDQWSPAFLDALVWALAARLAMPLSVKPELAQDAVVMAGQALAEALASDLNAASPDAAPDSSYLAARSW